VDIEAEAVTIVGFDQQVALAVQAIAAIPGVTPEQADVLVHHGFTSLTDLLQAEQSDLAGARRQIKVGEAQTPVA
jgi:predicted RecB family nuclease